MDSARPESPSPERSFIDVRQIVKEIKTDYEYVENLSRLRDKEIWIFGNNILRLYSL